MRSQELAATLTRLTSEIETSYERQEDFRRQAKEALGRFSASFNHVVRALIGNEATGRIEASGRSLRLVVEHHGERESAALETVKLLAFDLAALKYSIGGGGYFPRFLIHDGPREADMARAIYGRLFLYARQLEEAFNGEPGFQYIITTTTEPPDSFLDNRWLRLQLAGVPAEARLLCMDL